MHAVRFRVASWRMVFALLALAVAATEARASAPELWVAEAPRDSASVGPLAQSMFDGGASGAAYASGAVAAQPGAVDCMSMAIAYEAANQPIAGQEAVGQVILNRVRDRRYPKSVCGVVFQGSERVTGCQFTFTCDGSFRRRLSAATLMLARSVAESVMAGLAPDRVHGATHYHADYVLPYWASTGMAVAKIGAHIFYRMPGAAPGSLTPEQLAAGDPDAARLLQRFAAATGPGQRRDRTAPNVASVPSGGSHAMFAPWGLSMSQVTAQR